MRVENNRKNEESKHLKDMKIGQCFEDILGRIYIKTNEECEDGTIKCVCINNGYLNLFSREITVTPVNIKVVIKD